MQVALQEAQEEAVQAAFATYNSQAVGTGAVRRNYEKQLNADLERQFEVPLCAVKNNSLSFYVFIFTVIFEVLVSKIFNCTRSFLRNCRSSRGNRPWKRSSDV
jgi:hypothetical protein